MTAPLQVLQLYLKVSRDFMFALFSVVGFEATE